MGGRRHTLLPLAPCGPRVHYLWLTEGGRLLAPGVLDFLGRRRIIKVSELALGLHPGFDTSGLGLWAGKQAFLGGRLEKRGSRKRDRRLSRSRRRASSWRRWRWVGRAGDGKERRGGIGDWVGNGSSIEVKSGIWLKGAIDRQWSERRHGGHEGYKRSGGISGRMVWEGSGVVVE